MNSPLQWVRENLVLPFVMVVLTAIAAGVYQATEIDGRGYATLGRMYLEGTDRYRANLEAVANSGPISKWAFTGLLRDFWTDAHGLMLPGSDQKPTEAERAALMEEIKTKAQQRKE